jgi:hypothetical protein
MDNKNGMIVYQSDDGSIELGVRVEQDTVWLTQEQISRLFKRSVPVISRHIKNVFLSGELEEKSNLHFLQIAIGDVVKMSR